MRTHHYDTTKFCWPHICAGDIVRQKKIAHMVAYTSSVLPYVRRQFSCLFLFWYAGQMTRDRTNYLSVLVHCDSFPAQKLVWAKGAAS